MKFVSTREKRLWLSVFSIIAAIYSTLGMVRNWLLFLENSAWGTGIFSFGCCLILVLLVTRGMTTLPRWREILTALGIGLVYLLILVNIERPDERIHVIMYGVVALLIYEALTERSIHGYRVLSSYLIAIATTAGLGTIDELIQLTLPSRVFDVHDILYDIVAAIMAVTANASLMWARKKAN
ncbi:MAG: VanZ family protein [Bacteroidetes bacterium]|nr:VanZ family protein [Bacteroidota bacterium]